MTGRSMVNLHELARLACPYCGRVVQPETAWAVSAANTWGWCGVRAGGLQDVAGLVLVAPMEARAQAMISCLWVDSAHVGVGLGRDLIRAVGADLLEFGVRTLFAYPGGRWPTCAAPPPGFLAAAGFVRGGDQGLWRLDLDRAVPTSKSSIRSALDRALGWLRPTARPQPAGGAACGRSAGRT